MAVGALNGAMIVMDDLEKAENVWNNIHFSQVMDVDDNCAHAVVDGNVGIVGAVGGAVVFAAHEGQPCLFAQAETPSARKQRTRRCC